MHTLFDSTKEVAATIVDGKAIPADNFSGDLVASWLAEGVPGMKGTVVNGIATDMPVIVPPNDVFFQLALLDHIESIGWYFDNPTNIVVNDCGTGKGGFKAGNSCAKGVSLGEWAQRKFKDKGKAENFIKWFADSKVVDDDNLPKVTGGVVDPDGNPITVYHGTTKAFDQFSSKANDSLYGPGFYFTEDLKVAEGYSGVPEPISKSQLEEMRIAVGTHFESGKVPGWLDWNLENIHNYNIVDTTVPKLMAKAGHNEELTGKVIDTIKRMGNHAKESHVIDAYLKITKPFDLDNMKLSADDLGLSDRHKQGAPTEPQTFDEWKQWGFETWNLGKVETDKYGDSTVTGVTEALAAKVQALGYDGMTHIGGKNTMTDPHRVWIAFDPTQIKSTKNKGPFDPNDPVIYNQTDNAFCPTGEGGGQDNSCGSSRSKAEERLKDWLGQLASMYKMNATGKDLKYAGFQDLVLSEGEWYAPATKPKDVKWGKQKECFTNAFGLATDNPDKYTYVEGFATTEGLPLAFEHAWVVTNDGKVVDNTWRTPGNAYLGVPLSNSFLLKHTLGTGVYGVFSGYGKETMNLLKDGLPDNAKTPTNNAFCPTGAGGGVDPSCGKGSNPITVSKPSRPNEAFLDEINFSTEGGVLRLAKSKWAPSDWSVTETYVEETHRRQGIASRLVDKAKATLEGTIGAQCSSPKSVTLFWNKGFRREGTLEEAIAEQQEMSSVNLIYDPNDTTVNEQNCGVGKGGFLPGNKCAVGGTSTTRGGETLVELRRIDKVWSMADGKPAPEHVQKLGIPPAWKNVYANLDPNGTVLAKGEDSKGRIQTRYSDNHEAKAAAAKFGRVTELRSKRQEIFDELTADAKNKDLRDNAHCLEVIMRTGMRPGGGKDTKAEHKSFGAITLEGRHVIDNGNGTVTLRLVTGKNKGREVDFPITDSGTAKMLLRRAKTAGADGRLFATTDVALRDYSKTKDGEGFKTKDHRTALGTETAANAVKRMGNKKEFKSIKEYKEAVKEVATEVANVLGNTPIIALKSYVDPTVFSAWTYPR